MNHQPFETWLLSEQSLSRDEQRALQVHMQECGHCTALAEVNLALKSAQMAAPAVGFTQRFTARLEAQQVVERRNRILGITIFVLGGLALFGWSALPYLQPNVNSPAELFSMGVHLVFGLRDMAQAIGSIGSILWRVVPDFISPLAGALIFSAVGGLGWLWARSVWKFTHATKGVSV